MTFSSVLVIVVRYPAMVMGVKPLAVKRKARKLAKTGVEVENGSCPVSLHQSVKVRHLLS